MLLRIAYDSGCRLPLLRRHEVHLDGSVRTIGSKPLHPTSITLIYLRRVLRHAIEITQAYRRHALASRPAATSLWCGDPSGT